MDVRRTKPTDFLRLGPVEHDWSLVGENERVLT